MDFAEELRDLFLMQQVYSTLLSVNNKLQAGSDRYFSKMSSRQYMAMMAVLHLQESEATINNIARKLGTTKQNTKQLITALVKKRYAVLKKSETDRRAANVEITPLGFSELLTASEIGIMFLADVFNEFSGDELQVLWDLLKKLYRFDGKEQDGFETDVGENIKMDKAARELQGKALQAFAEKRKALKLR